MNAAASLAVPSPHLLLVGFEDTLADDLIRNFPDCRSTVIPDQEADGLIRDIGVAADILFCYVSHPLLHSVLVSAKAVGLPVVVVSERPEVEEWLNAMDAGAADYAAPPFDRKQIAWILNANLRAKALQSPSVPEPERLHKRDRRGLHPDRHKPTSIHRGNTPR